MCEIRIRTATAKAAGAELLDVGKLTTIDGVYLSPEAHKAIGSTGVAEKVKAILQ
jgi:hypothetical protein